jgi:hypothetical protein
MTVHELTEQEQIDLKIYADIEDHLPETIRDLITVLEYSIATKTPSGAVAAAVARLRRITESLEHYKRIAP